MTLTGVTVSDDKADRRPAVGLPDHRWRPVSRITCTATYTVTQADLDAGSVDNTATATGTPADGTSTADRRPRP